MTDTETHTVETAYGPAEIETYECDSCGNRVAYENTVEFTIGDREGRACEHCKEAGPISFPRRVLEFTLPSDVQDDLHGEIEYGVFFHIALAPITTPLILFNGFSDCGTEFDEGYATALIVMAVWSLIPLSLWVVL